MTQPGSVESALRVADIAMYQAKGAGGDQFRVLHQRRA
jgi:hypothetical protein